MCVHGSAVFLQSVSQHSHADPSVATSSCAGFGRVWTAFTAGAPLALFSEQRVRQEGSYLVDPASSHMLVKPFDGK